ncbi:MULTISPECIES: endonuclease V [unclassified Luteimonas]
MPSPSPLHAGPPGPAACATPADDDGPLEDARALQARLADLLELRDRFPRHLATIGGFSVEFSDGGAVAHATAVLLDAVTLEVLASGNARLPTHASNAQELVPFRALPALRAALAALPRPPDLAFVDGHGIAHPRGLGIAAHFGVASGLPCIGVARAILAGTGPEPHQTRGAYTALRNTERLQVGWLLRSRPGDPPLVVSPGHRVALASSADLVMRFTREHRLPEPTRLAQVLASRRNSANQPET